MARNIRTFSTNQELTAKERFEFQREIIDNGLSVVKNGLSDVLPDDDSSGIRVRDGPELDLIMVLDELRAGNPEYQWRRMVRWAKHHGYILKSNEETGAIEAYWVDRSRPPGSPGSLIERPIPTWCYSRLDRIEKRIKKEAAVMTAKRTEELLNTVFPDPAQGHHFALPAPQAARIEEDAP